MKTKSQIYTDLLDASKSQRTNNIEIHRLRTDRIMKGYSIRHGLNKPVPNLPLDFLAIGDFSWFEYPLYNNGPLLEQTAIIAQTQLGSVGNPPPRYSKSVAARPSNDSNVVLGKPKYVDITTKRSDQWLNQDTKLPDATPCVCRRGRFGRRSISNILRLWRRWAE